MSTAWTKLLVQQHAQAAVAVELYTIPFYFTALSSIKDTSHTCYTDILGVCMEEMLHLQLAANLCLALDVKPNFTAPIYGTAIPFLKPDDPATKHYSLINAKLGALDKTTLQTMLDIETPDEFQITDKTEPQTVYNSIAQMYAALLAGIEAVGPSHFGWSTVHQQKLWSGQTFKQHITNLGDAKNAVDTIGEQGEGKASSPIPTAPFSETDFPIPTAHQLINEGFDTKNQYSHYGRFIHIQNQGTFPAVYPLSESSVDQTNALAKLQSDFASVIGSLNTLWDGEGGNIWSMTKLLADAQACWMAGVVPKWS